MVPLSALWLPIIISAVLVFVVSSIIHMVLTYHQTDYARVAAEEQLMDDLRRAALPPGDYAVPHAATPKEMAEPAFVEKTRRGPVAFITVVPNGPPAMGKSLTLWFLYALLTSLVAGYVAARALGPGATYLDVFRFAGTTAFAAYVMGLWQQSIWYGRKWSTTLKSSFDGLVYALLTAGVFGWLWPGA
ncbi:MAG: hypothetical protein WD766_07945 [Gemmatimonadota bacterium]